MVSIIAPRFLIAPGAEVKEGWALAYDRDRILKVAPTQECQGAFPDAEFIPLPDRVLSPGFVNGHMHLYGTLAHGIIPPVPVESFEGFLEDYWWPLVENLLDPAMIAAATRASALELIDSGVTALCDVLEAPCAGCGALEAEAEVLEELGVRSVLSTEACERLGLEQGKKVLAENAAFARSIASSSLTEAMLCTHTSFTCSEDFMVDACRLAAELGVGLQFHLNESAYEGKRCEEGRGLRPTEWYEGIGVLSDQILAAQGVQLSTNEISLLARRGVRLVHVPLSNCEVGGGVAPVPELLAAGVTCGLGTDGYINDFLEVMRGAFLIHKGHREDPSVMHARTVYLMATEGSADAVYPGRAMARLQGGSPADFICLDVASLPTPATGANLLDQLILFRKAVDVKDVVVAGRYLKKDGRLLCGDFESARARTRIESERLWATGRAEATRIRGGSRSFLRSTGRV